MMRKFGLKNPERIRDPIHDLIIFRENAPLDWAAWQLVNAPELQRLRRIKQLGASEFVFPSATHTRFAHSIGVFDYARKLISIISREIRLKRVEGKFDAQRARVAVLASMLHDIGHGPFSHAFEEARKAVSEQRYGKHVKIKKHEYFSAELVKSPKSRIGEILDAVNVNPVSVADLIEAETPTDMYHAVVSSSFDADRLDYLQRDRYMTGVGAGSIDLTWLLDNVRVANLDVSAVGGDEDGAIYRHSFCLNYKARDAAEDFILSRYRLYSNLYFHKTTRGMEQLISAVFRRIAAELDEVKKVKGLPSDHPLCKFFQKGGESVENYRVLDDTVVWGAFHSLARDGDGYLKDISLRILERRKPHCIDVQVVFPGNSEKQRRLKHSLSDTFKAQFGTDVFQDSAKLSFYGEIGGDDDKAQKRVMIMLKNGDLRELTEGGVASLKISEPERFFDRYYFLRDSDKTKADTAVEAIRGRQN